MLHAIHSHAGRDCSGLSRRSFLQAGTLGLGGLTLPWLLQNRASAATRSFVRDKSVVFLFLSGGASHIETFNPNMGAPAPYHSMTGEVQTTLPGVTFGGTFPLLSRFASEMAIVRSLRHPIGGHVQAIAHMLTGGTDPNGQRNAGYGMGAVYSRLRGANHPATGMPTNTLLVSSEVDPQYRSERGRVERGSQPGTLGSTFAPFNPAGGGEATRNLKLNLSPDRFDDRRALQTELTQLRHAADGQLDIVDEYTRQAYDLLLGSASEAFDLSKEDPKLVDQYDTSMIRVGKKKFRPSNLGRHMLTARRLVEAGCGFVTVHSAGWDMHADGNNPGMVMGMNMLGRAVDKATSAFLQDLTDRGMLNDVLLIISGDFGRTPRINKRGGRDHWANLCTLAFAGGGINVGQVIGRSARKNDVPASDPVTTRQVMGSVMHTLFDIAELRLARGIPRELMSVLEQSEPVPGLL